MDQGIERMIGRAYPERVRFSLMNSPPSIQAARAKLDEVGTAIEHIAAELEFSTPEDFASDDDYQSWRKRATAALAYNRQERTYLAGWIRSAEAKKAQELSLQAAASDIARIDGEVKEINGFVEEVIACSGFRRLFNDKSYPNNLATARERRERLIKMRTSIENAIAELKERRVQACDTVRKRTSNAKRRLAAMINPINQELGFLRGFIGRNPHKVSQYDWLTICISLIERLRREGVALTKDEDGMYAEMIERRQRLAAQDR